MKEPKKMKMCCPKTGKLEEQEIIKESEDGITLRCNGCGKNHSHEIGEIVEFELEKSQSPETHPQNREGIRIKVARSRKV